MTDELTWDYTGDESSPLLQRSASPFYSGERRVINRRQARYILHNVNEVSRILQSGLGREPFTDVSVARGGDAADDSRASLQLMSFCRRLTSIVYRYCTQCIPVIIAAFVIISVVVESAWDHSSSSTVPHLPYVATVLCVFSAVLLAFIYLMLVRQAVEFRVTLRTVAVSFVSSVFVFALIYAVFVRFNSACLHSAVDASPATGIFAALFCRMLQLSTSVFTLGLLTLKVVVHPATGLYNSSVWYTQLILALQMLLAYCQFLLSLATLISHLCISSPISSVAAVGANPSVRQTARYDPDNESLGPPYGLHVIGNGNRDDGLTTSGRHNHGCYGATPPTQIPQSQCAAEVLLTAEDMYQSNSI